MTVRIPLGSADRLTKLYSFPNSPDLNWTLVETVKHWFAMTLQRDGLTGKGATLDVGVASDGYVLLLDGPVTIQSQLQQYAVRLTQFLINGENALNNEVAKVVADGKWNPSPDPEPYHPWRFFLPHGMAMLNQKAVLFFHYPPIRLLETNQDYLDDPVPVRCEELLTANGVSNSDLPLFNTVMDATPIGAEDDQGSKPGGDPDWGLIPINYFHDYQMAQVKLLLNTSPVNADFTVPIVIYGAHPLATFNDIYRTNLSNNKVTLTEIIPGKKTAVMASTHPYVFYGTAQGFDKIGSGKLVNPKGATTQMIKDLVVARWLKLMSDDPAQNPQTALSDSQTFWNLPAQAATVNALVQHQGSLFYSNKTTLAFDFLVPLSGSGQPVSSPKPPTDVAMKSPTSPIPQPRPIIKQGTTQGANNMLTVIGDSGTAVDWWFIYKVSRDAKSKSGKPVTGKEYLYFDSAMNQSGAKPILKDGVSTGQDITTGPGPLFDTLNSLFVDPVKSNPNIGWYCYNDEALDPKTGKNKCFDDRGHCKGALAFDLQTKSAVWLIHSVPNFPLKPQFAYPATGLEMAQSMLCIQLDMDSTDTAMHIAQLMYDAHGPNVNLVSNIPQQLTAGDPRSQLMHDQNGSPGKTPSPYPASQAAITLPPYPGQVSFNSAGGQKFIAIGKNKGWGQPGDDTEGAEDFYNDFVSVVLGQDLEVETWVLGVGGSPRSTEHNEPHKIEDMKGVDLNQLGFDYTWNETTDHAKLAISDRTNASDSPRWVCVGDINFTNTMEKRGGGTVAFQCESLWNSLALILETAPTPTSKPSKKTPSKTTLVKKPSTKKPPAKKNAPTKGAKTSQSLIRKKVAKKPATKKKAATKKVVAKAKKVTKTKKPTKPAKKVAKKISKPSVKKVARTTTKKAKKAKKKSPRK